MKIQSDSLKINIKLLNLKYQKYLMKIKFYSLLRYMLKIYTISKFDRQNSTWYKLERIRSIYALYF